MNTLRMNGVLGLFFASLLSLSPQQAAKQRTAEPLKVTRKTNAALHASAINRVEAVYPPQVVAARIFGTVVVEVTIDESGSVTSARAVSGHPLLKEAAVDAARGWTFK